MGQHLGRQRLFQLLGLAQPTRLDLEEVLEHLLERCPACREQLEAAVLEHQAPTLEELVQRAVASSRAKQAVWDRFRRIAVAEAAELIALPPEQRRLKVSRAYTRFRNPVLVDLLLDESRRRSTRDPFEAYELADCAYSVALRLSHRDIGMAIAVTCIARANAYRANALRAAGQFKQAEVILDAAVQLFDQDGTADPLVQGELMEICAALYREQRRFVEAEGCLDIAVGFYRKIREPQLLARTLVVKGTALFEAGEVERALEATADALQALDRDNDAQLYFFAIHNTVDFLAEAGRFEAAQRTLDDNAELYQRFDESSIRLRRQWIEGKIARGLGRCSDAERIFCDVRNGFTEAGLGYDAALVGLELAMIYVETGKNPEVRKLAEQMVPVFLAQDVHREAAAAVMLFQEAARSQAVTVSMLAELITYLRRVRDGAPERPS